MTPPGTETPERVLTILRGILGAFPQVVEEPAWTGVRWKVRRATVASVLTVDHGWPPAVARAAGTDGPAVVLVFFSADPELSVLRAAGPPFFAPPWHPDEVGMLLDEDPDPVELTELLIESYVVRAPHRLAATVERPPDPAG